MKQLISFGKYLLLERINVGGMAEIFLVRSRGVHGFKRLLAIKKILPTMAEDEEFIAMFVDEARIAAELSHAGIVQIYELGRFEQDYYIAMEFVHGKDLRYIQERMFRERTPLSISSSAFIVHKICEALDYAHNKRDPSGRPLGIIHRDVSPQNVIISYEGEVKICDFGIAKAANRSQKTQAGVLKGKFGYMSPEQVRGLPLDGRSDIFTVGTLLYEMVTLERLFVGESDFSTLEKVRNADVVPPSTYNRDVPEELEEIILKALAKEVEDRFQGAIEFADALQSFMLKHEMSSSRHLSAFMKEKFAAELEAELRRLEEYQKLPESVVEAFVSGGEQPVGAEAGGSDLSEVDLDAKTLIFASREGEGQELRHLAPPPIPGSRRAAGPGPAVDAGGGALHALADAKTMIFSDPEVQPEEKDIYDMPTRALAERPDLKLVDSRSVARAEAARSIPERFFLPLTILAGLLLGWSLFVTIQFQRGNPVISAPEFELRTRPATGVKVFLDDAKVATVTPYVTKDLAAGAHRLKIQHRGYEEVERKFDMIPGTRLVMEVDLPKLGALPPGKLFESAPPLPGTAPVPASPGADQPAGGEKAPPVVKPTTPEEKAELLVESTPPGATVWVDDQNVGKTPLKTTEVKPSESSRVVLKMMGYQSSIHKMEIKAGRQNRLTVALDEASREGVARKPSEEASDQKKVPYGYMVANTRPWSKVYVDGKYTGRETPIAPDKKLKLTAGKHKVVFETPKGKRYVFEVVIKPGKLLKLIKQLE